MSDEIVPLPSRRFAEQVVGDLEVIFYLNPGFLGDKVVLEALLGAEVQGRQFRVIGVEWSIDPISMMEFPYPPVGTFVLPAPSMADFWTLNGFLEQFTGCLAHWRTVGAHIIAHQTKHTNELWPKRELQALGRCADIRNLWDDLKVLAKESVWPYLRIPEDIDTQMEERIRDWGGKISNNFVTVHIRHLDRDPERNFDPLKCAQIAKLLNADLGVDVVLIGERTLNSEQLDSQNSRADRMYIHDLRNHQLSVLESAWLIRRGRAYIGVDSGPTHLACAVGARVVTINWDNDSPNSGFGPYCDPTFVVKLNGAESSPERVVAAVKQLVEIPRTDQPKVRSAAPFITPTRIRSSPVDKRIGSPTECGKIFSSLSAVSTDQRTIEHYNELLNNKIPDAIYVPFRTVELQSAVQLFRELSVAGFSVSRPFKTECLKYADALSDEVCKIGAANTIVDINGVWHAYNTDWIGALDVLAEAIKLQDGTAGLAGKTAIVYGGGGVARAICYGLNRGGCRVISSCRRLDQAHAIERSLTLEGVIDENRSQMIPADIFVNATPLNDVKLVTEFDRRVPTSVQYILDVAFSSETTALSVLAQSRRAVFINGWKMLERQALYQVNNFALAAQTNC